MYTKKQVMEAAVRGEGCLGKAKDDEPVFVLRAQDIHAADLVEKWAIWAMAGDCSPDKVQMARDVAHAMRVWPDRKRPD